MLTPRNIQRQPLDKHFLCWELTERLCWLCPGTPDPSAFHTEILVLLSTPEHRHEAFVIAHLTVQWLGDAPNTLCSAAIYRWQGLYILWVKEMLANVFIKLPGQFLSFFVCFSSLDTLETEFLPPACDFESICLCMQ